jgi:hypothetical protein
VIRLSQETLREVRIHVTDAAGKPVPFVYVQARERRGTNRSAQGQTDGKGVVLLQLPAGAFTVQVSFVRETTFAQPAPIELEPDQTEATFVLQTAAITTGTLLDPSGKPLAWATLEVHGASERAAWVWTDEAGRFRISTEEGVVFEIVFKGKVGPSQKERYRSVQKPMEGRLEGVRAGSTDVEFRATAVQTDGSLSIRVLSPSGAPIENQFVSIRPAPAGMGTQRTDADGRVLLSKLLAREVQIFLHFVGSPEQPWLAPPGPKATPDGREIVLRLRKGDTIEGVLLKADGTSAGMGSVAVMKGKQHVSNARSDAEGRFVVVVEAGDPGPYSLRGMVQIPGGNAHGAFAKGVQPGATGVELRFETIK